MIHKIAERERRGKRIFTTSVVCCVLFFAASFIELLIILYLIYVKL